MAALTIDSNIAVIATEQIGEAWATVILDEVASGRLKACTDSFYLLEILDAYYAKDRLYEGKSLYRQFKKLMASSIHSVTLEDFDRSAEWAQRGVAPRESLHAAVAHRHETPQIFSIDGPKYERIKEVERVSLVELLKTLKLKGEYLHERHR